MTRTATVTGPGGVTATLNIPEGATADQIQQKMLLVKAQLAPQQAAEEQKKSTFGSRLGDAYTERRAEAADIFDRYGKGEQGLSSTALQLVGKAGAGAFWDFAGEAMITGAKQLVKAIPGQWAERGIQQAGVALVNTTLGQQGLEAFGKGAASYAEWAGEHPVFAANFESVVNIAMLKPSAIKLTGKQGVRAKAGKKLTQSATRKAVKTKAQFVDDLVRPERTKKVKIEEVARTTEEGAPFRASKVALSKTQAESKKELMKLPLLPKRSLQKNYEVISKRVAQETDQLTNKLAKTGKAGVIRKQDLFDELDEAAARILAQPSIVGSSEQAAKKVIARMKQEIGTNHGHVAGLLKARKSFDAKFIQSGRKALLDPATENAMTEAVREIRRTVNNFIQDTVPRVGVKNSLRRQSSMLNAMDDLAVRAAKESNSAIGRQYEKLLHVLTLRGMINQTAALTFGVGGLGAAAMFAPWILGTGIVAGIGYKAGKVVMSPATRRGLGQILKASEKLGREGRLDRALILELLEMSGDAYEMDEFPDSEAP